MHRNIRAWLVWLIRLRRGTQPVEPEGLRISGNFCHRPKILIGAIALLLASLLIAALRGGDGGNVRVATMVSREPGETADALRIPEASCCSCLSLAIMLSMA